MLLWETLQPLKTFIQELFCVISVVLKLMYLEYPKVLEILWCGASVTDPDLLHPIRQGILIPSGKDELRKGLLILCGAALFMIF